MASYSQWSAGERGRAREQAAQVPWGAGARVGTLAGLPCVPCRTRRPSGRGDRMSTRIGPVLGLCSDTHDSAAALLLGGQLAGLVEEERLTGVKHTNTYPARGVDSLLREHDLSPNDVVTVAYNFRPRTYLAALKQLPYHVCRSDTVARAVPRAASFVRVAARTRSRIQRIAGRFPHAAVQPILHHRAHGLYAFASSDYDDAAVLIVDSLGEYQSSTIGHATREPAQYRIVDSVADPASLGLVYGAVTEHLGWRRGDEEGTVMALAALGDPARFAELFEHAVPFTEDGWFDVDPAVFPLRVLSSRHPRISERFVRATCPPRRADDLVEQVHRDLHLGWRRGDEEGTVMALAATGDPARFRALLRRAIVLTELASA